MHFAMPPRKSSHPPPFSVRSARIPWLRRYRLKTIAVGALLFTSIIFLLSRLRGSGHAHEKTPSGRPPVVIVTILEPDAYSHGYIDNIIDNRNEYAAKHGYKTFFANDTDYNLDGAPSSWSKIPAMRHAMTLYPNGRYFWYITQNALIMNPDVTVERHIMNADQLDSIMLRDQPIVPPDSVIKTFPQLKGEHVDCAVTQDADGLAPESFILRGGEWSKFFLDTWFDPLYRSYNFQKAETHALEHIVQWHPTILSKLALIPQRKINAYSKASDSSAIYKDGDFVISFNGCATNRYVDCEVEAEPFSRQWRTIFRATR